MRIALATTTINVPHVLKLYRVCDPDVHFFVATDNDTPLIGGELVVPNVSCTRGPSWKCSEPIGWNCVQRRNIAFLEAVKWGADVIVSIDDDNTCMDMSYFNDVISIFYSEFDGLCARGAVLTHDWFDPGARLLRPPARHRGIPFAAGRTCSYEPITDAKIGVVAGLCLGDPDIDATTRIEHAPEVHQVSELARSGVVVDLYTHTVFNSQNSAILREFVPAWFMMPGVGRMDDIYASLIVQRVMRERGYHVHFGKPFVWQQRNRHDLLKDLRAEIDGYENVETLATILDLILLPGPSVIADVRRIYETLAVAAAAIIPAQAITAAMAWLEDIEGILG